MGATVSASRQSHDSRGSRRTGIARGNATLRREKARALRNEKTGEGRRSGGHERPAGTSDGLGSRAKRRQSASMTAGSNWVPELRWSSAIASSELRAADVVQLGGAEDFVQLIGVKREFARHVRDK